MLGDSKDASANVRCCCPKSFDCSGSSRLPRRNDNMPPLSPASQNREAHSTMAGGVSRPQTGPQASRPLQSPS